MLRRLSPLVATLLLLPGLLLAAAQVRDVQAIHRAGQTFVTFREILPSAPPESLSVKQYRQFAGELTGKVRYRVYRSNAPIRNLDGLRPLAELPPLTGWNVEYYGDLDSHADKPALRYVIEDGKEPLPPGNSLFVHNPDEAGEAFYAVTAVLDGVENAAMEKGNSLRISIREIVGAGEPVLQRIERPRQWQYVDNPTLHYFVRWEAPPNCSVEGKPFDYVVGIPPKLAKPAGVGIHLHCWGGSLDGGYGWWYRAEQGNILIASNQIPYDWWTGYHEKYWENPWGRRSPHEKELWQAGVVRPYSQTRMLSFLDWVATRWEVDKSRTHVAGNSMGGSGAPMLAIRCPDRIAWATSWVGVHIPNRSPQFAGSYAQVYGEMDWGVKCENGQSPWDHYNDALYLRRHPDRDIGLICFSNGKNDGAIGWPQAVEFYRALQETRQPHLFVWGQRGHGQRAVLPISLEDRHMPLDLSTRQSLPAFTHCSLDQDPGSGDPTSGAAEGQSNLHLFWKTEDIVDRPDRWEMTLGLVERAPEAECTVDVTPRRLQQLKLKPGETVRWTNRIRDTQVIQSGQATANQHGLITLPAVRVSKSTSRVSVERPGSKE